MSDRFAGIRPSPGGLFAGLDVTDGAHGPVITTVATRAECSLSTVADAGWYQLVEGAIESVILGEPTEPLLRFRGRYRGLEPGA